MMTHPEHSYSSMTPQESFALDRRSRLPSVITSSNVELAEFRVRYGSRYILGAVLGMMFVAFVGFMSAKENFAFFLPTVLLEGLGLLFIATFRDLTRTVYLPLMAFAKTPHGADLILRGDELMVLVRSRAATADESAWREIALEAKELAEEQQAALNDLFRK